MQREEERVQNCTLWDSTLERSRRRHTITSSVLYSNVHLLLLFFKHIFPLFILLLVFQRSASKLLSEYTARSFTCRLIRRNNSRQCVCETLTLMNIRKTGDVPQLLRPLLYSKCHKEMFGPSIVFITLEHSSFLTCFYPSRISDSEEESLLSASPLSLNAFPPKTLLFALQSKMLSWCTESKM